MDSEQRCASCGILIRWQATIVDNRVFCCLGCAQGGPCRCDYDNLPQLDQANLMVLQRGHPDKKDRSG